jgi:outer membrane protein OmpA-like peptidoglycan-associated protein
MRRSSKKNHTWIAFSDLLSGLLLAILVLYMYQFNVVKSLKINLKDKDNVLEVLNRQTLMITKLKLENEQLKELINQLKSTIKELQKASGVSKDLVQSLVDGLNQRGVKATEKNGSVNIDSSILFEASSYTLPSDQMKLGALKSIGRALNTLLKNHEKSKSISSIMVIGHADQTGPWSLNQKISTLRANTITSMWTEQVLGRRSGDIDGCEIPKILAAGFGESRPLINVEHLSLLERHNKCQHFRLNSKGHALTDSKGNPLIDYTQKGCKLNRRIEIMLVPKLPSTKVIPGRPDCP